MPHATPDRGRRRRQPGRVGASNSRAVSSAERERRIAEMIREALELLRAEQLGTTRRHSAADDDEDPTRRLGARKRR